MQQWSLNIFDTSLVKLMVYLNVEGRKCVVEMTRLIPFVPYYIDLVGHYNLSTQACVWGHSNMKFKEELPSIRNPMHSCGKHLLK